LRFFSSVIYHRIAFPLLGITGIFAPGTVWAQNAPRRQPINISFYTGTSTTLRSDIHIVQQAINTDATYRNIGWDAKPFSGSVFYGIRASYYLPNNPRLGFQLDFNHYKAYARVQEQRQLDGVWLGDPVNGVETVSDRMDRFNLTNGINIITPGVLYRGMLMKSTGFPDGRVQPYIGGGPSFHIIVPLNNINERTNDKRKTFSGVGYQLQAGVNYGITSRFSVFAEGKFTQGMAYVGTADDGKARTGIKSFLGIAGLTYGF
jgi:lipid A oxidase